MASIESLKNGMQVVELIAEAGGPVSTPDLIEMCGDCFEMSASQVRNSADTLAEMGWLQKIGGDGSKAEYGLGGKAARLWAVYLGLRLTGLEEKNRAQAAEIGEMRELIEAGTGG